jgi:hypothetical protein
MNMKIQYCNKSRWGLAPLAPNDAPPLLSADQEFCYLHRAWIFITIFITHNWTRSWPSSSSPFHLVSRRSISLLFSHLQLGFPHRFSDKMLKSFLILHISLLYFMYFNPFSVNSSNSIWWALDKNCQILCIIC